ncbi:hypothetical protein [Xanthomonas arboricola]|uniref:hypothetical protein n=1 Tax=Xanthomonas arboricola TaxID=56448 RepID=UPI000E1EEE7F|nr:hypothetical protein [Xanthomonas arboricola]
MQGYRQIAVALLCLGTSLSASAATAPAMPDPANAPEVQQWAQQVGQAMQARLQTLAVSEQPRQRYVAGLLWLSDDAQADAQSAATGYAPAQRAVLQGALDARPRDLLVARVEANGCPAELRCDPAGAVVFLEQADAGNADAPLRAFSAAQRRGDRLAAESAWQAAARADHFDSGAVALGQALHAAYAGMQWPQLQSVQLRAQLQAQDLPSTGAEMAMGYVMGAWAAHVIPSLAEVTRRCTPPIAAPALRDECMAILGNLGNDDAMLVTALIGSERMADLSTGRDAAYWHARVRELRWLQQHQQRRTPGFATAAAEVEITLTQGEIPSLRASLQRSGIAALPPADWHPVAAIR